MDQANKNITNMSAREFSERYNWADREQLGEGGFGTVYKVYDRYQHSYVALIVKALTLSA